MVKINQADLKREIEASNRKDSRKKFFNFSSLRLMLDAAKAVKDTESFAKNFTPTRGNNAIARKLKLGLDVKRGRWVLGGEDRPDLNRLTRESTMTQVNEAVDGKKLIELLMQALDEGDTVRFTQCVNQMLSLKVSECLQDQRVLMAEQLFTEDLTTDLVKVSNLNRNKDSDSPEPEDEQLPNMELATDELANDDTFEEGSESVGLDTFRG